MNKRIIYIYIDLEKRKKEKKPWEEEATGKSETGMLSKHALSFSVGLSCGSWISHRSSTCIPSFASGLLGVGVPSSINIFSTFFLFFFSLCISILCKKTVKNKAFSLSRQELDTFCTHYITLSNKNWRHFFIYIVHYSWFNHVIEN